MNPIQQQGVPGQGIPGQQYPQGMQGQNQQWNMMMNQLIHILKILKGGPTIHTMKHDPIQQQNYLRALEAYNQFKLNPDQFVQSHLILLGNPDVGIRNVVITYLHRYLMIEPGVFRTYSPQKRIEIATIIMNRMKTEVVTNILFQYSAYLEEMYKICVNDGMPFMQLFNFIFEIINSTDERLSGQKNYCLHLLEKIMEFIPPENIGVVYEMLKKTIPLLINSSDGNYISCAFGLMKELVLYAFENENTIPDSQTIYPTMHQTIMKFIRCQQFEHWTILLRCRSLTTMPQSLFSIFQTHSSMRLRSA